jgi:hypothetical protein
MRHRDVSAFEWVSPSLWLFTVLLVRMHSEWGRPPTLRPLRIHVQVAWRGNTEQRLHPLVVVHSFRFSLWNHSSDHGSGKNVRCADAWWSPHPRHAPSPVSEHLSDCLPSPAYGKPHIAEAESAEGVLTMYDAWSQILSKMRFGMI